MATHVGERWGNYQLVQLLGQGGFAEVYLGEHVRLGMRAAIKILHSRLAGEAITSFQHEAKTIASLAHPHIVRVLDFDVQQGTPFLVLEYAPHGSLRQKHPSGERVPLTQVVDYVQQIASALQYAHDRKLIHRDLKPENMLLNAPGQVILADFGIAALAHSTSSIHTQDAMGTLAYMAPEQIQGKPRPASDQYALAVTVYQWISGALPFQGSSTELIAQHLAVAPPSLRQKVPDLPPEVDQTVLTALLKNPQERFGSVQAFANEFTIASKQAALPASPPSPLPPTQSTFSTQASSIAASPAQPRIPTPTVDMSQQVGAYRLSRVLEQGDLAESYLGKHVRTGAYATIKLFYGHVTGEEAFRREAQRLARVIHPHIARIHDFGIHEQRPFLIVEYLPDSLRLLYPPGARLPISAVIGYVKQVGAALQYAHEQGLVHGDVRPERMLLKPQDHRLLLSDLGAITLGYTITSTTSITVNRSPYMAPEQVLGEPQPASDQYALARVVYEWLSGERAVQGVAPFLQAMAPGQPMMIEPVLRMALADDPGQRFKSIQAFVTALEQTGQAAEERPLRPIQGSIVAEPTPITPTSITLAPPTSQTPTFPAQPVLPQAHTGSAQGQPIQTLGDSPQKLDVRAPLGQPIQTPPMQPGQMSLVGNKGISRRALLTGLGIGVGGLALTGLGVIVARSWPGSGSASVPTLPSDPIYVYQGYEGKNGQNGFDVGDIEWSPDSKRIISFATPIGGNDNETIRIWDAVDGGNVLIYTGTASIGWVGQTPYVAWVDNQSVAHIQDLSSGKTVATYADAGLVSWSPDGSLIALLGGTNTISVWNPITAQNFANIAPPSTSSSFINVLYRHLLWSPDGTRILSCDVKGVLYTWNAHSGNLISSYHKISDEYFPIKTADGFVGVFEVAWSPDGRRILGAAGSSDQNKPSDDIHVWNAEDGSQVTVYKGHVSPGKNVTVDSVAWSPDGKMIASQAGEELHVWDATTGTHLFTHPEMLGSRFAWSPLTGRIASRGTDSTANLAFQTWDATTGGHVVNYTRSTSQESISGVEIAWSPDGQFIIALEANNNNDIDVWRARER